MSNQKKAFCHYGVSEELKHQFVSAASANDRVASQVMRDLMREYIFRNSKGRFWDPGAEIKRNLIVKK
ncbi:hypothetical protein [Advenella kashmirensis]|uniref:hypothetical protein n=1 Tax=Advenella kashmirensis TaxID=310575 RepID=UPI0011D1FC70|nr:hypothetical protein [Advenella kashmirensis]